jgi:hypothetical protein
MALAACLGCGSQYKLAPVSGTIKVNGKGFPNAHVTFEPFSQGGKRPPPSIGITDADGKYSLKTIDGDAGAVVGEHRIAIVSSFSALPGATSSDEDNPQKPKEVFPPKYNSQSDITREVTAEGTDTMDFEYPARP